MKKTIILLVTVATILMVSGFTSVNASDVVNYQDVTVEINGKVYETNNTDKEVFKNELEGGINKIKIMSVRTDKELQETNLSSVINEGDYYLVLTEPKWFGEDDDIMEETIFVVDLN